MKDKNPKTRIDFRKQITEPCIVKTISDMAKHFDESPEKSAYRLLQLGVTSYNILLLQPVPKPFK